MGLMCKVQRWSERTDRKPPHYGTPQMHFMGVTQYTLNRVEDLQGSLRLYFVHNYFFKIRHHLNALQQHL